MIEDLELLAFGPSDWGEREFERFVYRSIDKALTKPRDADKSMPAYRYRAPTMNSETFRNLRAGPVMEAGSINPVTVRAWVRNNQFRFGDRDREGHPRYDLADVARLTLMRFLSERLSMGATAACWIVNSAYDEISELSDQELAAIDHPSVCAFAKHYVMLIDRVDTSSAPRIVTASDLALEERADQGRRPVIGIHIDLREVVRLARDHLCGALNQSTSGLDQTFGLPGEESHG